MNKDEVKRLLAALWALTVEDASQASAAVEQPPPGMVRCAKGRLYPAPVPQSENFLGYAIRCSELYPLAKGQIGAVMLGTGHLFADVGGWRDDGANWAEGVDRLFHPVDYQTGPPDPRWEQLDEEYRRRQAEREQGQGGGT